MCILPQLKKKSISKVCILYDSIYTTFWKWQNYRNEEQMSGCDSQGYCGEQGGL